MKNMTKMCQTCGIAALVLVMHFVPVRAENLRDLQVKALNAVYMSEYRASNNPEAMLLTYVGSSTEAVLSIEHLRIVGYAPFNVPDANFGTAGVYDITAAAYDTMGELCDAIDDLSDYKCSLLDAKRDDDTQKLRDQVETSGTNDLKASGGFRVKEDTGASYDVSDTNVFANRIGITPLTGRRVLLKECKYFNLGGDNFKVFGKLRKWEGSDDGVTRDDTTVVWNQGATSQTLLTVTFTDANGSGGLQFAVDEHVVIGNDTDAATAQAATNSVLCRWIEE